MLFAFCEYFKASGTQEDAVMKWLDGWMDGWMNRESEKKKAITHSRRSVKIFAEDRTKKTTIRRVLNGISVFPWAYREFTRFLFSGDIFFLGAPLKFSSPANLQLKRHIG